MGLFRRRNPNESQIDAALRDAQLPAADVELALEPFTAPVREQLRGSMRPAIRYGLAAAGASTSRSHIGGRPDAPAGFSWPTWTRPDGATVALNFFAQLDLADTGILDLGLPDDGLLLLFADYGDEAGDGIFGLYQHEHDGTRALHVPVAGLSPQPTPRGAIEYGHFDLIPVAVTTFALLEDLDDTDYDASDTLEQDIRGRVSAALPDGCTSLGAHQLGGNARWIQHPVEQEVLQAASGAYTDSGFDTQRWAEVADQVADWSVLFQLDEDTAAGLEWGDGGVVSWAAPRSSLATGQFQDVWFNMQC